jgi:hypothetical protein
MQQFMWGFAPPFIMATALELRLFNLVAEGVSTLPGLLEKTGASRRGLTMLLNMIANFGFLARQGQGDAATFSLTPESEAFLVEGKPSYLGGGLRLQARWMNRTWSQFTECVRTGKPAVAVDNPEEGVPFWAELVDTLFPMNYPNAVRLGEALRDIFPSGPIHALDVASGSGVWGIAMTQRDPAIRITAFDLPETLEFTRKNAERLGVGTRVALKPGNIRDDALGNGEYDAVVLGHICHSEGEAFTRHLLRKTAGALRSGGVVAIAEMVPDDDRSGPTFPLLFALNMLVHTTDGDTFTFAEYDGWLREAGFTDTRRLEGTMPSPLILATRT